MQPKKLHEGDIYYARFDSTLRGKDAGFTIVVRCDSVQAALLSLGELLPLTDCKLSSVEKMVSVRGVIV